MTAKKMNWILWLALVVAFITGCADAVENEFGDSTGSDDTETAADSGSGGHQSTDTGTSNGSDSDTGGIGCVYHGKSFAAGDPISSVDGTHCNDCTCAADGTVSCVDTACVQMCEYGGKIYSVGQSFPATDGCNTCTCTADGNASCTKMACLTDCSASAGTEYFEPGCGGDDFIPVIAKGCYQSCSGTPCRSGVCQITDINPCLCEADAECCNACGARESLCLDAPTACGAANSQYAISGGENSFGECMGECQYTFATHAANSGECATVTLDICGWGTDGCTRSNSGTLTPLGNAKMSGLAMELEGAELAAVYGCPDCADGGASQVALTLDGTVRTVSYEFHNPPDVLERADEFTASIITALNTCTNNENIVVDAACATADVQ